MRSLFMKTEHNYNYNRVCLYFCLINVKLISTLSRKSMVIKKNFSKFGLHKHIFLLENTIHSSVRLSESGFVFYSISFYIKKAGHLN